MNTKLTLSVDRRVIEKAYHAIAVRVYQGEYLVQKAKTISGKEFTLLNLPFYLVHRIGRELDKIVPTWA